MVKIFPVGPSEDGHIIGFLDEEDVSLYITKHLQCLRFSTSSVVPKLIQKKLRLSSGCIH